MKKILIIALSILLTCDARDFAQTSDCIILSANYPFLLNGISLLPTQVVNKRLSVNDSITANHGEVIVTIRYGNNDGTITLPADKTLKVSNLLRSSFCQMDVRDKYKPLISGLWNFLMYSDEEKHAYHKRYLRERAGQKRGEIKDVLADGQYKTELRSGDEKQLMFLDDLLRAQDISDSAVIYLTNGVFFEKNDYLRKAYENYYAAHLFLKKIGRQSAVVTTNFKQFLYRMGRFDEGDIY